MTHDTWIVEYDNAEAFLADYDENLAEGSTFIQTDAYELDTILELVITFPGLRIPIRVEGVVRFVRDDAVAGTGVGVELVDGAGRAKLAAVVEQIRNNDPRALARVVKVLLAEDNHHLAELVCNGLTASARRLFGDAVAFSFGVASNGADALQMLREEQFHVMIVDIYLPIIDGAAVIATARNKLALGELPIISMSGGDDGARTAALTAGATTFLEKPVRLRQVMDTMRSLVKI